MKKALNSGVVHYKSKGYNRVNYCIYNFLTKNELA